MSERVFTILMAVGMTLGLAGLTSGCATRSAPATRTAATGDGGEQASADIRDVEALTLTDDERARVRAYIRAIEAQANRRNVDVVWINPPDPEAIGNVARLRQILRRNTAPVR